MCYIYNLLKVVWTLLFRAFLKSNSKDFFLLLFVIKNTLMPYIYLSQLVMVCLWSLEKEIIENFILETLEQAKSAKSDQSPQVRARLLMHISKS